MKVIKVNLKERSYNIVIGSGLLQSAGRFIRGLNLGRAAYIITNASIYAKYGRQLSHALKACGFDLKFKLIADSEKSKSLKTAYAIIKDIALFDHNRRVFIIAFGGGVIGDLSGFVASIYKRGIAYVQIPTTLLAQVDSAIGGKTAVDLTEGKNLVGTFYQPRIVLSDVSLLKTLDSRQIKTGLAEVVKYALIKDRKLFDYLEINSRGGLKSNGKLLEFIVARCAAIKAKVVEADEKDTKGIRMILNFGHTLGHAIEAASGYKGYNHGEAVALGMLLALDISEKLGLIKPHLAERIELLIRAIGLPVKIAKKIPLSRIIRAHYRDKKFSGARNRFVLIMGIGKTKIVENIPLQVIKKTLAART